MKRNLQNYCNVITRLATLLFFLTGFNVFGQTTLAVGDVSIVGFNANAPDNFTFVTWVNLAPNTVIKFTDNGFLTAGNSTATNNGRGGENFVTWTNTTSGTVLAGTVIKIENGVAASLGTSVQTMSGISSGGDQIFAYQGTGAGTTATNSDFGTNVNPSTFTGTILFGLNFPNVWLTAGTVNTNNSYLPAELNVTNGNIVIGSSSTGGQYSGSRTNQSSMSAYRALVNTPSNWTVTTGSTLTTLGITAFTITTATPTITTTGTPTAVNTTYGTASTTPTSFSVSGANLTNNILITPPTGFEVSQTAGGASGYADTQTLTQTGGTVSSTPIFLRLKATATVASSPYSGNVVLTSSGATTVNVATASSTVTAKDLTITGISADNKIYDANNSATISGTPAYVGLENSETFAVTGSPTATFINASVGTAKSVSVSGYTAPSTNYSLTQPTLSANITAAPLTITGAVAQNKDYDGNNAATFTGTLNGVIGAEIVTFNSTGTFAQANIGAGITVTSTATLGGVDAGNYSLTQPTGLAADITAKSLTITGLAANNKVFDGNTTATLSETATLNGIVLGEEANVVLGGTVSANFAQSAVGTGIAVTVTGYTISGSASGNYSLTQPTGLVADITNAPTPVITSLLTASATYGVVASTYTITASNSPTSYNATGLPVGLYINTATGEITGAPFDIAGSPFNVTISATNAGGTGNATLIYTINPKPITLNLAVATNKIYDRTDAATITGTLTGVVGADAVTLVGTGTFAQLTAGTNLSVISTATLGGADAAKYSLTQPTGLTADITPKQLSIMGATAANKTYDANTTASISGASLVGIITPDVVSVSGNGTFASADAANGIAVSTALVLGGADAANYSALQPSGITANITPAALTISGVTANNKVYDGNTAATLGGTPTLNGIINSDDVSISGTTTANFNNKDVGLAKPVTVTGYTLSGTKATNYSVTQPTGLTAEITAKSLTINAATAQNKIFDGNTNAVITGTLTGVVSPDAVTFAGTGTFASSAVGNGIAVTSTSTLGGAGVSNYTLTQPTGLTANITAAPSITEIVFPQYAINGSTTANRLQYVCRLRLNNLSASTTYRYTLGAPTAGNMFVINNSNGTSGYITGHTSSKNVNGTLMGSNEFATTARYGELTTDATGTYEGWFAIVPTGNAAFNAGLSVPLSVQLNNGASGTTVATTLTTTQTFTMLTPASGTNGANAIRGSSGASAEEMIFLYDNTAGTGRPLYGTWAENDGITTNFTTWYGSIEGNNGSWGAYIPVNLANGVRRIEKRDVATGAITGCPATDTDGIWSSGASTVNPAGGTSPIIITAADAPLNTCQILNTAPTIAMNVAATSDYIDGGVTTNITGNYAISGVINDPTDPAKTLGIDFIIGDAETAVGSLIVSVTSSNTTVVPITNLALTTNGADLNLKITPATVGYATVTITVNDGTVNTNYIINYAASQAATSPANTRFHAGKSDASTAVAVGTDLMLVADDEDQTIRLYDRNNSGLPINKFDFTTVLGLTQLSGGVPREVDIEASTKVGNSIYWLGSQSNASSGNSRPNRNRVFKTDISGTGTATTLNYVSRYDFLKDDILAWDASNGHGKGANYYGLAASAAAGVIPESASLDGYNIEGVEMAPDNTTAYIAFRAPQVIPSDRKKALIIPVSNFTTILTASGGTIGSALFGTPIEINLGGRGIREIKKNTANEYLIIAGPSDAATGVAPKDFKFFTWSGNPADEPIKRSVDLATLNVEGSFESIVELPASLSSTTNLQLLVDNGDAVFYGDAIIAKDLAQTNFKKFRSEKITLSVPALATSAITGSSFCKSSAINVPFTFTNETFISGNIFTAQLSDANGSFANPVSIGTLADVNAGTISATIPTNALNGTNYRIRVISSNPTIIGADNGTNLSINPIPAKPTITPASTTICSGTSTTLTASACTGGTLNWTGGLTGMSILVNPTVTN